MGSRHSVEWLLGCDEAEWVGSDVLELLLARVERDGLIGERGWVRRGAVLEPQGSWVLGDDVADGVRVGGAAMAAQFGDNMW